VRSRRLGIAGLIGLAIAALPLAAPGAAMVPAASGDGPGWLLGVYGNGLGIEPGAYYGFLWLAFASYLCVLVAAPALDRRLLRWGVLLFVVAFALAPPLLSQDVFSYIDYARLGVVHDLNPYTHTPAEAASDPAFVHVGWADSTSAYGPLFTIATYPLAWMPVSTALWLLKGIAAASVLGLAALVARLAAVRGLDPSRGLAMVALNPLVLVHVVGGAHNDATTMLLAVSGCASVLALREASAGVALVSAVALKVSSAFVIPFAFLGTRTSSMGRKPTDIRGNRPVGVGGPALGAGEGRWWGWGQAGWPLAGRLLAGMVLGLLAIAVAALAAFGPHALDSLVLVGENQARVSNYSLPNLSAELLGVDIDPVRSAALALYCLLLAALLAWVWRGADWVRATGWAALGLLLASAWLLPWYIVWALPFAAISRDGRLVAAVLALTALQLAARVPL
jgi:glycosyl transferase family 87